MSIEERHQFLEGEVMAAKDAIWRLTTRVFHLEKEVKDLKLVLKYTAKGIRPRTAKFAELARMKKSKTITTMVPILEQTCVIKTEPMSDHLSSAEEGEEESEQFDVRDPLKSDSDTNSADSRRHVVIRQKNRKTVMKSKSNRGLSGHRENARRKGQGRSKSPTWEYFSVENKKYRNKDTLATCKTCNKNFAWPKIERLRKHVIACCRSSNTNRIYAPTYMEPEQKICNDTSTVSSVNSSSIENDGELKVVPHQSLQM